MPEPTTIRFLPPEILLRPIELPDRTKMKTVGDMILVILEDEKAIRLKNADLQALREYRQCLAGEAND